MNEKFMKVIKIAIPTLTVILIASQLFGAPATTQDETLNLIQNNEQIEIEIAVPKDEEQGTEHQLTWIQLYDLDNYQDTLRTPMEHAANQGYYINPEMKEGVFYHNELSGMNIIKNNTLMEVLDSRYSGSDAIIREETIEAFADAAYNTYADLEEDDTMTNFYMAINGYFNLLPDAEPAYANPNSTLTRAEFMALLMRAETKVDSNITINSDFEEAVGESQYNLYAQALEKDSYLNLSDGSLNEKTYNGTISRAEAIYMLMNHLCTESLAKFDVSNYEVEFTDVKDGGDIATKQGFAGKNYANSYALSYFINNPDDGVPSDIYKAIAFADSKGYLDDEVRADEGITKAEAIELLMHVYRWEAASNLSQSNSTETPSDTEINTEQDSNTEVEDNTPSTPEDTTNPGNTTDTETETPSHPSGMTPNSQGIIILDEDTNGDGLLSRAEAGADGFDYYKVCYNPDNTTYLVNIFDGSIVHLLESFTDAMGEQSIYAGRTPEDTEWIENHRFDYLKENP